jgi:hypothetical protein
LLKWAFVTVCLHLVSPVDILLSWLPGYYLGKLLVFVFILLDNKLAKYSLRAVQDNLVCIEVLLDDLHGSVKRAVVWGLVGVVRLHLLAVSKIMASCLPEQLIILEELCSNCIVDSKPEFKVPPRYMDLIKQPATPRTPSSRQKFFPSSSSKFQVRMNIRSAASNYAPPRFFPFQVWVNKQELFWQAEGDNLVQSDEVVSLLSSDDKALTLRLKLAKSIKVVCCLSEPSFIELLSLLK